MSDSTMTDRMLAPTMSLRDYFAAHAPTEPQEWFQVPVPPPPEKPAITTKAEEYNRYIAELEAWRKAGTKARLIQWPYAWADAVLDARGQ